MNLKSQGGAADTGPSWNRGAIDVLGNDGIQRYWRSKRRALVALDEDRAKFRLRWSVRLMCKGQCELWVCGRDEE